MSWISQNGGESAADFLARLANLGAEVPVQKHSSSSIAYAANGLTLRQLETVTVTEYRALSKAAADTLAGLGSDTTTTTVHYRQIGSSADYAAVAITTGTKTEYSAARGNEADGWRVTKTEQSFSAGSATGWSTTRPSAATTGIAVSTDRSCSVAATFDGDSLVLTETTTVTEYRHLTKSEADSKMSTNTSADIAMTTFYHSYTTQNAAGSTSTLWTSAYVQTGTDKSASSRYVDAENGYTVSVTQRTLSAAGTNWSTTHS